MEPFDFWMNWGVGLNDRDFANAFMALGFLEAQSAPRKASNVLLSGPTEQFRMLDIAKDELLKILTSKTFVKNEFPVMKWGFPSLDKAISLGAHQFHLSELSPLDLALLWKSLSDEHLSDYSKPKPRIRITSYSKQSSIRPWFRILTEADPDEKSVSIHFKTPHPDIHIKWPIRLGFIPENGAQLSVLEAHDRWPSSVNSVLCPIDRENDNCDVLVFDGNMMELNQAIGQLPVPMKCNLIILRGNDQVQSLHDHSVISNLMNICKSNGIIIIKEVITEENFKEFLNSTVEGLCHNIPLDLAVNYSLRKIGDPHADPLVFLNRNLADFRLKSMVSQILELMDAMPPEVGVEIPLETKHRLNIPIETGKTNISNLRCSLNDNMRDIVYISESTGATGLTEIAGAIREAELAPEVVETRSNRYLSVKAFIKKKERFTLEKKAFLLNRPAKLNVRIAAPDKGWERLNNPIDMSKLPPQKEAWKLKVVLSDPNHIKEPLLGEIKLPKDGASEECEFVFIPTEKQPFEGRITILHRGRTIQTGLVKMPVVDDIRNMPEKKMLELTEVLPVAQNLGGLEHRRQFDMSFVTNHTSDHRPILTAVSDKHAWLVDLDSCASITKNINFALSEVARSVEDYKEGLESKDGQELLMKLVLYGCDLNDVIIEESLGTAGISKEELLANDYLQIVTTRKDKVVPFEFIYDYEVPDADAKLCEKWRDALEGGKCPKDCAKASRKTVCPLGFWGLRKVIERHYLTAENAVDSHEYTIQSADPRDREVINLSGIGLVAASQEVETADLDALMQQCGLSLGNEPVKAEDWEDWESKVNDNKPNILVVLPHNAGDDTLEINDKKLQRIRIRESHLKAKDSPIFPLVALLGCDTSCTVEDYGSFVQKFQLKGAGVVIGTIATVFGKHAAQVAKMLVDGLSSETENYERIGELMRAVKRKSLLNGLLMSLCMVAFGDADWKLKKQ